MSPYSDSIHYYYHGKAAAASRKAAASSSSSYTLSDSKSYASSMLSDTTYVDAKQAPSKSTARSIKSWAKELISDLGQSPTHRYDAAHPEAKAKYETNILGGPSSGNQLPRI